MSDLPNGEYLLTNVQWRKKDGDTAFRTLHGFTTGTLVVSGSSAELSARFNDQFLSNRLSDLEMDEVPVELQVSVLEEDGTHVISAAAPAVDRSGASYMLRIEGTVTPVRASSAA